MKARWVLLRGLMRERGHWGGFPDRFGARLDAAAVVTPDLAGNGARHLERSPARIDSMVDDCRAAVAARGLRPPYRVLAMSLGAMVAVAWAHAHPEELAAIVLINTSLRPTCPLLWRLRPARWPALLALTLRAAPAEDWERTILAITSRMTPPAAQGPLLERWIRLRRAHPVTRANALRQLAAALRYRAPPDAPPVPTLLLAGARDALVDPRCSRRLSGAWRVPLEIHPEAGHDLPLDAGAWVAARVAEWVGEPNAPVDGAAALVGTTWPGSPMSL